MGCGSAAGTRGSCDVEDCHLPAFGGGTPGSAAASSSAPGPTVSAKVGGVASLRAAADSRSIDPACCTTHGDPSSQPTQSYRSLVVCISADAPFEALANALAADLDMQLRTSPRVSAAGREAVVSVDLAKAAPEAPPPHPMDVFVPVLTPSWLNRSAALVRGVVRLRASGSGPEVLPLVHAAAFGAARSEALARALDTPAGALLRDVVAPSTWGRLEVNLSTLQYSAANSRPTTAERSPGYASDVAGVAASAAWIAGRIETVVDRIAVDPRRAPRSYRRRHDVSPRVQPAGGFAAAVAAQEGAEVWTLHAEPASMLPGELDHPSAFEETGVAPKQPTSPMRPSGMPSLSRGVAQEETPGRPPVVERFGSPARHVNKITLREHAAAARAAVTPRTPPPELAANAEGVRGPAPTETPSSFAGTQVFGTAEWAEAMRNLLGQPQQPITQDLWGPKILQETDGDEPHVPPPGVGAPIPTRSGGSAALPPPPAPTTTPTYRSEASRPVTSGGGSPGEMAQAAARGRAAHSVAARGGKPPSPQPHARTASPHSGGRSDGDTDLLIVDRLLERGVPDWPEDLNWDSVVQPIEPPTPGWMSSSSGEMSSPPHSGGAVCAAPPPDVSGRFTVVSRLTRVVGGSKFGEKFVAVDSIGGRRVVLWRLPEEVLRPAATPGGAAGGASSRHSRDADGITIAQAELAVLQEIRHPRLCPYLLSELRDSQGSGRRELHVVVGLAAGGSLAQHLAEGGPTEEPRARQICLAALEGLVHLHSLGLVHGALRSGNVLLGPKSAAWLSDFGLASLRDAFGGDGNEAPSERCWLAPELWGGEEASEASDVWALGCLAVEMLTGAQPFNAAVPVHVKADSDSPAPLRSENTRQLHPLCRPFAERCLLWSPVDRPPSTDLLGHLASASAGGDGEEAEPWAPPVAERLRCLDGAASGADAPPGAAWAA